MPCLVGVGLDLSQRDDAVLRLRHVQSSLEKAQRIAHLGSWEYAVSSGTLAWSDEIHRIFGAAPGGAPVTYGRFLAHVHPDDLEPLQRALGQALRGEVPLDIEHRIVRADGDVRWVHELGELQYDGPGPASRLIGTVRDVTDRKRAQLQLHQTLDALEHTVAERTQQLQAALHAAESADRVKSAFLATMSHELRTPLNSIIGFTGILLQSLPGPINAEQARQLDMVRGSARHLLELINDVLDISRIEAGQMPIHPVPFELVPLVQQVVGSIAPQAHARGLTLATILPGDPVAMVGDRRRVEQVLINLVCNAVKFTERGGVTVHVVIPVVAVADGGGAADTVRVQVVDTGIGIAPDDLDRECLPFHQVDTGLARTHDGTGLGLAICQRLVELMGGRLDVASAVGVGSTFTVTLPRSNGASDA